MREALTCYGIPVAVALTLVGVALMRVGESPQSGLVGCWFFCFGVVVGLLSIVFGDF